MLKLRILQKLIENSSFNDVFNLSAYVIIANNSKQSLIFEIAILKPPQLIVLFSILPVKLYITSYNS